MSGTSTVEGFLHQAEALEKEYDWIGAVELYRKALSQISENDFFRIGDIYERLGHALYLVAFQAESNGKFGQGMREAVTIYEKARECYGKSDQSARTGRILRSNAMIAFTSYWLAAEKREKRRLVDECWKLTCEALESFDEAGDEIEFGKTFNNLSKSADFSFCFNWEWETRERTMREAIEHGERTIKYLSSVQEKNGLAKAYVKTADYLDALGYIFLNREGREKNFEKARGYWRKANELSEDVAVIESLSVLEGLSLEFGEGTDQALRFYEKALEYGKKTKDNFIVGRALDMLAYHTAWSVGMTDDLDESARRGKRALEYAAEARSQYSKTSYVSPGYGYFWVEAPYADYYWALAFNEADLSKRRELLKKAEGAGAELLEQAENSGYPDSLWYGHHVFSMILTSLANIETNAEEKRKLLEKSLEHKNGSLKIIEQIAPSMYWERGTMQGGKGAIKSQLASLAVDSETKRKMLREAVTDREISIELLTKGIVSFEKEGASALLFGLAFAHYQHGLLLNREYDLTKSRDSLTKALEAFGETIDYARKLDRTDYVAESHWKTAKTYDSLGEHTKAAENFELASNDYRSAAEKTRQLKGFYLDHAVYMWAWSEIEKARYHHERQEYGLAKEHFEKAADMHKSLKQWSYLESNYSAWARVEKAEEHSRKEESQEAIEAFEQGSKLFSESKKSLRTQLSKTENTDEEQMVTSMIKASDLRKQYCDGRIALEEAKILDKKGDHLASSGKYGSAGETFEKIDQALESEQERREFRFIIDLSRAWQKMMLADAKASPELYLEASTLFEQANKESNTEKTGLLALGHSRFCRALEAGTRFADTGNATLHTVAIQQLESAAKYYVKAGFQSASDYANATGLLFDAYVHMNNAKKEDDPEKKTMLYTVAEKVLQTSAGSYLKAGHPERREQVMRLLDIVREERELAVSIAEVLHPPSVLSTTTSFVAPNPTSEEAVGSERFEHADVQANLIIHQKELKVGENLDIELELVNAGKGSALLTKVTEIIPIGFLLADKPEIYRVEDSYLNMKGKRLASLKTEEVKLVLRPMTRGTFSLKPTVLYLDENGNSKSHRPEPVTIVVKELGIRGWIKGER